MTQASSLPSSVFLEPCIQHLSGTHAPSCTRKDLAQRCSLPWGTSPVLQQLALPLQPASKPTLSRQQDLQALPSVPLSPSGWPGRQGTSLNQPELSASTPPPVIHMPLKSLDGCECRCRAHFNIFVLQRRTCMATYMLFPPLIQLFHKPRAGRN